MIQGPAGDTFYDDYGSGKISEEFWTRRSQEWEAELQAVDAERARLEHPRPRVTVPLARYAPSISWKVPHRESRLWWDSMSFVDAYAPHRAGVLPLFARVHIDPCERNGRRRPSPRHLLPRALEASLVGAPRCS